MYLGERLNRVISDGGAILVKITRRFRTYPNMHNMGSNKMAAPSKRLVTIDLLKNFIGMRSTRYLGRTQNIFQSVRGENRSTLTTSANTNCPLKTQFGLGSFVSAKDVLGP